MFTKLSNSWELVKASVRVLRDDKELIIFPILSAIGLGIVSVSFFVPFVLGGFLDAKVFAKTEVVGFVILFLFYLAQYCVIFFCNTALVGAAMIRLRGGNPTVSDGFRIALSHFSAIFGYALIAATVGVILNSLARSKSGVARMIVSFIGLAWNVATYLVVPILASQDIGPIAAIKRSVQLLKKTWGEQIIGNFGLGAVFSLATFVVIITGIIFTVLVASTAQSLTLTIGVAAAFIILLALVGLVSSALEGIYSAAVFQYAEEGRVAGFFDEKLVRNTFVSN